MAEDYKDNLDIGGLNENVSQVQVFEPLVPVGDAVWWGDVVLMEEVYYQG